MKDCHFGSASAAGDATAGLSIAGPKWHNCWVENCYITGVTGILVAAGCIDGWNSIFKSCTITTGYTAQTKSIDDNATTGFISYVDCRVKVKPTLANTVARCFGTVVADETAFSASTAS
jgi:hypothetical protein